MRVHTLSMHMRTYGVVLVVRHLALVDAVDEVFERCSHFLEPVVQLLGNVVAV